MDTRAPIAVAARTGEPAYANTRAEIEREYPDGARLVRYAASSLAVPLKVAGEVVGSTGFPFNHPHAVDDDKVALATVAAEAGGQALERARLHELEQSARVKAEQAADRTRLLQDVSQDLTAAATPAEVAEIIVRQTAGALAADAVLVYRLDADRGELRLLAHAGVADDDVDAKRLLSTDVPSPESDAVATGEPLPLRTRAQILDRYGDVQPPPFEPGEESSYCFPLAAGTRTLGAVRFVYRAPTVLDSGILAIAGAIFQQGAVALDRSFGFEEELATRRRSERLLALTGGLSGALTSGDVAEIFIEEVIGSIGADAAALSIVDGDTGQLNPVAWRGVPNELVEGHTVSLGADRPGARALRRRRPAYYDSIEQLAAAFPGSRERAEASGMSTFAYLPLWAAGSAIGLAVLGWGEPESLAADDRPFLEAIAGQCALALDRARRYEEERDIAETLQRSVLPESIPSMEGVRVAALYLPGSSAADVGGDWFDTLTLADGTLGFVVGDVVGKGVEAAATMAQLRNGMRALTLDNRTPGETVTKLNLLLASYTDVPFATLAYVTLDPGPSPRRSRWQAIRRRSMVSSDGTARFLEGARGLPLGADPGASYSELRTRLEPGATIVLYTDGLVERPDRSIDDGLDLLARRRAGRRGSQTSSSTRSSRICSGRARAGTTSRCSPSGSTRCCWLRLRYPAGRHGVAEDDAGRARALAGGGVGSRSRCAGRRARQLGGRCERDRARGCPEGASLRLDAVLAGDRIRVEVADEGRWKEPRPRENRGLGLRLIEALMASVDVDRRESGTRVVMERPLTREPARSHGTA